MAAEATATVAKYNDRCYCFSPGFTVENQKNVVSGDSRCVYRSAEPAESVECDFTSKRVTLHQAQLGYYLFYREGGHWSRWWYFTHGSARTKQMLGKRQLHGVMANWSAAQLKRVDDSENIETIRVPGFGVAALPFAPSCCLAFEHKRRRRRVLSAPC
jgi:hypothetical protein